MAATTAELNMLMSLFKLLHQGVVHTDYDKEWWEELDARNPSILYGYDNSRYAEGVMYGGPSDITAGANNSYWRAHTVYPATGITSGLNFGIWRLCEDITVASARCWQATITSAGSPGALTSAPVPDWCGPESSAYCAIIRMDNGVGAPNVNTSGIVPWSHPAGPIFDFNTGILTFVESPDGYSAGPDILVSPFYVEGYSYCGDKVDDAIAPTGWRAENAAGTTINSDVNVMRLADSTLVFAVPAAPASTTVVTLRVQLSAITVIPHQVTVAADCRIGSAQLFGFASVTDWNGNGLPGSAPNSMTMTINGLAQHYGASAGYASAFNDFYTSGTDLVYTNNNYALCYGDILQVYAR